MKLDDFIRKMPKVELHVHLEGSIRPETLLQLSARNHIELPANDIEGLTKWYQFVDFPYFIEVYKTIGTCLCTADDIELIAREFLSGQAEQNILHSEVTYTPHVQYYVNHISFSDQLAAINRARSWAAQELGVSMTLTIDIPRQISPDEGLQMAEWAIEGFGNGVSAFGLGGKEEGNPPQKFKAAFDRARAAGLPSVPHAGETVGPDSIWDALRLLGAQRIGHGVRCLEDPDLVNILRIKQIPLEVCPTSNICLNVFPSIEQHPLPRLMEEGLYITINSDDPPMFNTTLTDEYLKIAHVFSLDRQTIQNLVLNGVRACLLPENEKDRLENRMLHEFDALASNGYGS